MDIEDVLRRNKEIQSRARELNTRAGEEVFKVYKLDELTERVHRLLGGARRVLDIEEVDRLLLPALDEDIASVVMAENPDTITMFGWSMRVTYADRTLPSITLSYDQVEACRWRELPDAGIRLPGGRIVEVVVPFSFEDVRNTDIPALKQRCEALHARYETPIATRPFTARTLSDGWQSSSDASQSISRGMRDRVLAAQAQLQQISRSPGYWELDDAMRQDVRSREHANISVVVVDADRWLSETAGLMSDVRARLEAIRAEKLKVERRQREERDAMRSQASSLYARIQSGLSGEWRDIDQAILDRLRASASSYRAHDDWFMPIWYRAANACVSDATLAAAKLQEQSRTTAQQKQSELAELLAHDVVNQDIDLAMRIHVFVRDAVAGQRSAEKIKKLRELCDGKYNEKKRRDVINGMLQGIDQRGLNWRGRHIEAVAFWAERYHSWLAQMQSRAATATR